VHTQGNLQSTGKLTDVAIQGEGFFVLTDGTQQFYSRDGSFDIGTDGRLVNPNTGTRVQGWTARSGVVDTAQPVGDITVPIGQGMVGRPSTALTVTGNLDASARSYGTVTQVNSAGGAGSAGGFFTPGSLTDPCDVTVRIATGGVGAGGAINANGLQFSTDGGTTWTAASGPAGGPFTLGSTGLTFSVAADTDNAVGDSYSFQAFSPKVEARVNVYDSLGEAHLVKLTYTKSSTTNTWTVLGASADGSATIHTDPAVATTNAPFSLTFSSAGRYTGPQPAGPVYLTLRNGASSPLSIPLDLAGLTQLAGTSEVLQQTDGAPSGSLVTFQISTTGEVTGIYSNGLKQTLGQMALATFQNPGGLLKIGGNMYQQSPNSGAPSVGIAGASGRGQISTGFLEMSNVDLAQQFTNMIMAQRGFQSNSRVITTSDEILQDLVNIKR
jgi:flagellar hook protein FlgE